MEAGKLNTRVARVVAALALGALCWAPAAPADTTDPHWTCRASAGYIAMPGEDRDEPVVANGNTQTSTQSPDRARCADDQAGASQADQGGLSGQGTSAQTSIDPDGGAARDQTVSSSAQISDGRIQNGDGSFVLTAAEAQSQATARCLGETPTLTGSSSVSNASVNGTPVATDSEFEQVGTGLNGSPLGGLIRVSFNEQVAEGDASSDEQALTVRAVHVRIFDASGATIFESVLAESKVDRHGATCAAPSGSTPTDGTCPAGSTFDAQNNVCVAEVIVPAEPGTGECPQGAQRDASGQCVQRIVVAGEQFSGGGPRVGGGFLVFLKDANAALRRKSPCRNRRYGTKYLILGTTRKDRITGTNRADRVAVLGASDRVDGGRSNDCVEGGAGNDRLDGSEGADYLLGDKGKDILTGGASRDRLMGEAANDKLIGASGGDVLSGGAGRDKLSGGLGNDRLYGGAGSDQIHTGNGRDRVYAGAGNDAINAATAGPASYVNCGPGVDSVRINSNERRRLRGCERVLMVRSLR
jgi:hypothetical protein